MDKEHQLDAIDPEPAWRADADTVRPRVAARGLFDTEPGGSPGDPVIDLRDRIAIQIAFIANRPLLAARRAGRELCDTRTRADVSPCRAMRGARQTDRRPRSPTSPRPRPPIHRFMAPDPFISRSLGNRASGALRFLVGLIVTLRGHAFIANIQRRKLTNVQKQLFQIIFI